jgi:hypothetical protein
MATSSVKRKQTADTGSRQRVQLDFTPEAFARLQEIKDMADATSNAEVVRNAIRLYDWFLQQRREEYKFQLVKGNKVKEIELLL